MCDFLNEGFSFRGTMGRNRIVESARDTDVALDELAELPHAAEIGRIPFLRLIALDLSYPSLGFRKRHKLIRVAVIVKQVGWEF